MDIRNAILQSQDIEREPIDLPPWEAACGCKLFVRGMTAFEADKLGEAAEHKQRNYAARITVLTLVTEAGERVFQDGDVKLLKDKSSELVAKVAKAAMRLSGLESEDVKKNGSDPTDTDDSPSASLFLSE